MLVSIVAVSGPLPAISLVYSARSSAVGARRSFALGLPALGSLATGSGFMSSLAGFAAPPGGALGGGFPLADPMTLSAGGLSSFLLLCSQPTTRVTKSRMLHVLRMAPGRWRNWQSPARRWHRQSQLT